MTDSLPDNPGIPVSSLIRAYQCPRRYYFSRHDPVPVSDRYIICKQVSLTGAVMNEEEIWDQVSMVHPDIDPGMRAYLSECLTRVSRMPAVSWTESDISVSSPRLGIHGMIDKYDSGTEKMSVVRCTRAPAAGCWPADRIRVAAYLLCLLETGGISLPGGYIEYIPDGIIRYCEPGPRDRRALLQAAAMTRRINQGELPPKPLHAPCRSCPHTQACSPPPAKRLSELLFKKRE